MRRARLSHHRSVFEPQNMVRELRRFLPVMSDVQGREFKVALDVL